MSIQEKLFQFKREFYYNFSDQKISCYLKVLKLSTQNYVRKESLHAFRNHFNSPGILYIDVISLQLICNKWVSLGKHIHIVFSAHFVMSRFVYKTLSLSSFQHNDVFIQHIIMKLLMLICSHIHLEFALSILKRLKVTHWLWNYLCQSKGRKRRKIRLN